MVCSGLFFLLAILLLLCFGVFLCPAAQLHTGIILLGGTGDLARKYLWQALFNVYMEHEVNTNRDLQHTFTILAGASSHASVGFAKLKDIFDNSVVCTDAHGSFSVCTSKKGEFYDSITYFQLLSAEDYQTLCESLESSLSQLPGETEREIVIYLAVPPSVFLPALKNIKAFRKFSKQGVSVKVVLEKPQGHNYQSAEELSSELLAMFEEHQLFRVDHYLAKSLVTTILLFRAANPQLERLLNRDHVDRVEIFLKETVGVEERYGFYNDVGVVRDVFQNHLTQLLALVTLDLPANMSTSSTSVQEAKVEVLRHMDRVTSQGLLLGQYASYAYEAARELPDSNVTSLVPTFAAALVKVQSPRWADVPFVLVSGKKLDERSSYIRVIFKHNRVCVTGCRDDDLAGHAYRPELNLQDASRERQHSAGGRADRPLRSGRQLVFQIGHGGVSKPLVSVSTSLGEPVWPECLQEVFDSGLFAGLRPRRYHGASPDDFFHATPVSQSEAYSTVLEDVIAGLRERFVSTRELLLAWRLWDRVLDFSPKKPPRIYDAGDPAALLDFEVKGSRLAYSAKDVDLEAGEIPTQHLHHLQTPATFLGRRLVSGTRESLVLQLALDIEAAAEAEIASKGVFHVAFSGGTSPIPVWQALAQSFASENWAHIHVWQVDERCVRAAGDSRSNLFHLDRHLLRLAGVPWAHVHTMPVELAGRTCDPELQGARLYADSLRQSVANLQLDFVLLGLGEDGHTASLFPRSPALNADWETLVVLTDGGPGDTPTRMTMTLPLLNRAKRLAFLVTGPHKRGVLDRLENGRARTGVVDELPALGVNPGNGTLAWYIDYDALLGNHFDEIKR